MKHSTAMLLLALTAVLATGGCGKVRYPRSYVMSFPPPAPRSDVPATPLGPLTLHEFYCPEYLCDSRIVYRASQAEVGFYEFHRWALSPRQAITQLMADTLRARSLFSTVSVQDGGVKSAYVLRGRIERLEEVDQDRDVRAVCSMTAELLEIRTGAVVWSDRTSSSIKVEKRDIAGVVSGLSAAAQASIELLVTSIGNQLEAEPRRQRAEGGR